MRLRYVATRNLATGHSATTEYEIDHGEPISLLPSDEAKQTQSVGLDQVTIETNLQGFYRSWKLKTKSITTLTGQVEGVEHWEEWFHSVIGGVTFELDPNDDQDDDDYRDCILVATRLTPTLVRRISAPHMRYNLEFREI